MRTWRDILSIINLNSQRGLPIMAFDKSKLPAPVRAMMEALEARGVKVHVAEIKIDGELATAEHMGGEKFATMANAAVDPRDQVDQQTTSAGSSTDSDEDSQEFVDTLVDIVKDGLQSLHNHLCPRIKENKARIETLEREARTARRDIDELKLKVFELQGRLDQRNAKIG